MDNNNPFNQPPSGNGDERHHAQDAIWLGKIEDAWIRNCTALHFVHSGFTTSIATRATIDSCSAIDPISIIDGGRRYNFNAYTASQLILVSNCYASYGRHSYVSNGTSTVSGIVFSNCISEESFAASEGHRLWSQGLLYDNLREINTNVSTGDHVLGLYNRGDYGSGHGWASAHSVAWNCTTGTGNIIIQKPPTAQNYAIGCLAGVTGASPPAPFNQPQGYIEGTNRTGLNPRSLYLAQLAERLSTSAVEKGTVRSNRPTNLILQQNYPNPFNPSTTIRFEIPDAGFVSLMVFDILGEEVATLVNAEMKGGSHEASFDASRLASGVYFYRLSCFGRAESKHMLLHYCPTGVRLKSYAITVLLVVLIFSQTLFNAGELKSKTI